MYSWQISHHDCLQSGGIRSDQTIQCLQREWNFLRSVPFCQAKEAMHMLKSKCTYTPSSVATKRENRSMFSTHHWLVSRQIVQRVEMYLGGSDMRALSARRKANHLLRLAAYFFACRIEGPRGEEIGTPKRHIKCYTSFENLCQLDIQAAQNAFGNVVQ